MAFKLVNSQASEEPPYGKNTLFQNINQKLKYANENLRAIEAVKSFNVSVSAPQ
jgi:hypothetical protein